MSAPVAPAAAAPSTGPANESRDCAPLTALLNQWLETAWSGLTRTPVVTGGSASLSLPRVTAATSSNKPSASSRRLAEACSQAAEELQRLESDLREKQPDAANVLQTPLSSPLTPLVSPAALVEVAAPGAEAGTCPCDEEEEEDQEGEVDPVASLEAANAFLLQTLPVHLASLTIEFELTRYTRLGTRVTFQLPSAGSSGDASQMRELDDNEEAAKKAASDSHGFVRLESDWPFLAGDAAAANGGFTVSLSQLVDCIAQFYEANYTQSEWRFLRAAVDAGTLGRTDPFVQELLLPPPIVSAAPSWPTPHFNWPERWITRALELMELDMSGTLADKGCRIWTEERLGGEKYGTPQSFDAAELIVLQEARAEGTNLPHVLSLSTSDWAEEDVSTLSNRLWRALPLNQLPASVQESLPLWRRQRGKNFVEYEAGKNGFFGVLAILVMWVYRGLRLRLDSDDGLAATLPDAAGKIDAVLSEMHAQQLASGKYQRASAAADDDDATTPLAAADRFPCKRHMLLAGRQRLALFEVTSAELVPGSKLVHLNIELGLD